MNPIITNHRHFLAVAFNASVMPALLILMSPSASAADTTTNQTAAVSNAVAATTTPVAPARGGGFGFGNNPATEKDHQNMMDQLGIKSIRRGRDGNNTNSPFYANYDESKANPFPNLPDPLILKNGRKVTTPEMWWKQRRPEIVEDFDREIYGRVPANTPKVNWEVTSTTTETNGTIPVITKILVGHVDNSAYHEHQRGHSVDPEHPRQCNRPGAGDDAVRFQLRFWPFRQISAERMRPAEPMVLRAAVSAAALAATTARLAAAGACQGLGLRDHHADERSSRQWRRTDERHHRPVNKGQSRKPDDWGALRAWAWGASRVLDYFETDKAVDAKQVGIEGHLALWQSDTGGDGLRSSVSRLRIVSSSGEGGAKLYRRNWGEWSRTSRAQASIIGWPAISSNTPGL